MSGDQFIGEALGAINVETPPHERGSVELYLEAVGDERNTPA